MPANRTVAADKAGLAGKKPTADVQRAPVGHLHEAVETRRPSFATLDNEAF
jgi:hypothetical protein